MTNKEIINKLRNELEQLRRRIMNLKIFVKTEKFKKIEQENEKSSNLLIEQGKAMIEYQNILIERIAILQDEIYKEK